MEMHQVFVFVWICFAFHCLCYAFNIDVSQPRILTGPQKSMFGFTSLFHQTERGIKLIVGAPKAERKGKRSGVTFTCGVSTSKDSCEEDYIDFPLDDSSWLSDEEMYGSVITKARRNIPLVCAPKFRDEFYTIGRCSAHKDVENDLNIYPAFLSKGIGYQRTVSQADGRNITLYWNAMGQWGMSADTFQDGSVLLGRPGFMDSRGGVVMVKDLTEVDGNIPTDISTPIFSYIGYSVTTGNFCGGGNLCFATGGPRKEEGKVLIYRYRKRSDQFKVRQKIKGKQIWSYFGASLCSADVNSDGLDDLLVGAPYYSDLNKRDNSGKNIFRDEGRVTVYLNSQNPTKKNRMRLVESITLDGSNEHDARFGTAITNIGDINGDGYTDVAVGAPFESDGQGAVYIYHGGKEGLQATVKQKIMGRDVSKTMTSFGWSISKPHDIDDNNYPDVAIGAYKSDTVVILRTKAIVNLQVTMTTVPNLIKQNRHFCSKNLRSEACFKIRLCFIYTGKSLPKTLEFNVTLTTDTTKQGDRKRALLIARHRSKDTISKRITLRSQKKYCENYKAETRKNQKNDDPFNLVRLEAKYDLIQTTSPISDLQPVLNLTDKRIAVHDTAFQLDCGRDNKCESDLVLELKSHVIYENYDVVRPELNSSIIVNVTKFVVIEAKVVNKEEDAFATVVRITWTGSVTFQRSATSIDQPIACDIESGEVTPHTYETECKVLFPIEKRTPFQFKIHFRTEDVNLDNPAASANVSISLKTGNIEIDKEDNSADVAVPMIIDACTIINGLADPDQIHVQIDRPPRPSINFTHMYVVKNKGPSFLPSTDVLVELPYMTNDSAPLTKDLYVTISHEDETSMSCRSRDGRIGGSRQPPLRKQYTSTKQTTSSAPVTETSNLPRHPPSKLLDYEPTKSSRHSLDCATYRCKEFLCPLQALASGESAVITADISLWVAHLAVYQETLQVKYFSTATVIPPTHLSFYPWNGSVTFQLMTRIYPHRAPKLNLFIIIGSAVGGVILFILIIIGLWRCGFFKREKKYKVKEWGDSQKSPEKSNRL